MKLLGKLLKNDWGAGAIEYGLVASLISIAAISAFNNLGSKSSSTLSNVDQTLKAAL